MRIQAKTILAILILFAPLTRAQVASSDPIDAMNAPSRHAWNLFLKVNHPALSPDKLRGTPDPKKRVGDAGLTVWETWKSAGTEVFFPDGRHPGAWEDMTTENAPSRPKRFDLTKSTVVNAAHLGIPVDKLTSKSRLLRYLREQPTDKLNKELFKSTVSKGRSEKFNLDTVDPDGVFENGGGETRMNKATFDFIVNNELYNIEGQESLFEQITKQGRSQLSFPVDSVEVKSMWIPLTADDLKPGAKGERYHLGKGADGITYGLVALHIITKDIPKWFWCSFRQVDGPSPEIPSVDTYGRPSSLNGTKWQYYELSGTQTDFTDALGRPTLLSDPHIEFGFQNTSCITCHAFSNIGAPSAIPLGDRFPFFKFAADPTAPVPSDALLDAASRLPIGNPPTSVFFSDPEKKMQKYVQLDFVFSTAFRARRKAVQFRADEHVVKITEFRYEPPVITVKAGESVVWQNDGKHRHNAKRDGMFDTGLLDPGERSAPVKFATVSPAEGLEYHCTPHPFMKAIVKVIAP